MLIALIDKLGDRNAQLFRELKGRLTPRNVLSVAFVSLMVQVVLLLAFSREHCLEYVDNSCAQSYWETQWLALFRTLDWMLPLILFGGGAYQLCADLAKEESRGTLNFIRLSPQSSQSFWRGKLLGVPVSIYLWIALAVPLHLGSAIAAGVSLGWVLGFYTLVAAGCCFFYNATLLNTLLTNAPYQAIAGSILAAWLGSSYIGLIESLLSERELKYVGLGDWQWFFLHVGRSQLLATLWMLLTVSGVTYFIWQALNRRFHNRNATLLSKQQSYWLVGSFQVWLLGLFWPILESHTDDNTLFGMMVSMSILNLLLFLAIFGAISPHRQALQDWARYKHVQSPVGAGAARPSKVRSQRSKINPKSFIQNPSVWQDLIWAEKSPSVVAIAINVAMTGVIWLPWILLYPGDTIAKMQAIAGLLLSLNLIWIYGAIAQLSLLMKKQQRSWAAGTLMAALFLPTLVLSLLSTKSGLLLGLGMFFVFGSPWIAIQQVSAPIVFLTFLGHIAAIAGLSVQLTRQLNRAGESDSKALLKERCWVNGVG